MNGSFVPSRLDKIITMARTIDNPRGRPGLAKKAVEASAARLAARAAASASTAEGAGGEEADSVRRTSPRRDKRHKSIPSSTLSRKRAETPSQLVAESQSLLSPPEQPNSQRVATAMVTTTASATRGGTLLAVVEENVESQLTRGTDFPSDRSESSDDNGVAAAADGMTAEALVNFFKNSDNHELEVDRNEMEAGLDDLNDYSSDQFSLNERRHYFMERAAISSQNRAAVEFVYMVEAETSTRDSGTRGLPDVKKLLHSKYIELIRQIPTNHFSEFGLREAMIDKYYGAKKGGASGFYKKVLDVKNKVQAVTRLVSGVGTPGRGLNDVKEQFILDDYKSVMGPVSHLSVQFYFVLKLLLTAIRTSSTLMLMSRTSVRISLLDGGYFLQQKPTKP